MEETVKKSTELPLNSAISFRPLFRAWDNAAQEGREGAAKLYQELRNQVNQFPELMEPITDLEIIKKHKVLVEELMATLFPVTLSYREDLFAVSVPLTYKIIHCSDLFRVMFLNDADQTIKVPDEKTGERLKQEKRAGAYQLILKKFFNVQLSGKVTSVHSFKDSRTGLDRYMELTIDARFIDVFTDHTLPKMPEECKNACHRVADILAKPELLDWLPLDLFRFEGIAIVQIKEVTERAIISNIKNSLLTLHSFSDVESFKELQSHIENLAGIPGVHIGITPFFRVNNHNVFSELHDASSFFLNPFHLLTKKTNYSMM